MLKIVARISPLFVLATVITLAVLEYRVPPPPLVLGLQLLAVALVIWARSSFPARAFRGGMTPGGETIIRRGPYAVIRHPMYAAAMLFIWSGLLAQRSALALAAALVLTGIGTARILVEERVLREHFPDYAEYARATKAVVPFIL